MTRKRRESQEATDPESVAVSHDFVGERCFRCGVNIYDTYIYGPNECGGARGLVYVSGRPVHE